MNYFELSCKCFIKQDIFFKNSFEIIAKYINFSMCQDERYLAVHNSLDFKPYCFNSFYPPEQGRVYEKDKIYTLTIRAVDRDFIYNLVESLRKNINNANFLVLETKVKTVKKFFVTELYTVTPTIVTIDNKPTYWTREKSGDIVQLVTQLHDNVAKKYQQVYNRPISATNTFIQLIELMNQKPENIFIIKNKKQIRLFGNKFKIVPHEDETSQALAFVALSCGLGEKQSYGGGFCTSKGIKI
ncbi:CRISPR-associated endoribonuclease Cas6 [Candidatus Halobeggiatoa sp. HSG11]|nr:CRISPR-associated endoribonuclease Cas6 [Candidatus Halobeggiatoa sp. HSG11]